MKKIEKIEKIQIPGNQFQEFNIYFNGWTINNEPKKMEFVYRKKSPPTTIQDFSFLYILSYDIQLLVVKQGMIRAKLILKLIF